MKSRPWSGLLIGFAVLFWSGADSPLVQASVVYVSTTGADSNDGQKWATAKKTVTAGLAAAIPGDQVWVAAGTYVECITLTAGVGLYGGFAGNEADLAERNWVDHITVLDGNAAGSVVRAPSGATASTSIDGFTIRNGRGRQNTGFGCGSGIYCNRSSPTITNNTITGNVAVASLGTSGGGICCYSSSPVIANNRITNNTAYDIDGGGGILCREYSSPTIVNNVIAENTASQGNGGGIACRYQSSPLISDNIISGNEGAYGGGIFCDYSAAPLIVNNKILGNMVASGPGGGIYSSSGSPTVANNVVAGNKAGTGGGIYYVTRYPLQAVIANNTITGNSATHEGGAMRCDSTITVANNIVAFNSSGIYNPGSGTPPLENNCVYNPGGYDYSGYYGLNPGTTDLSADPQLLATEYGEVHLKPGSPCIDAGSDALVQPNWMDLDGLARVRGTHVDIGADEFDDVLASFTPGVIRVSPSGDDLHDGSSWALAKKTVQAAIDSASRLGGAQVWVAAGTFNERITLRPWAHLYGGFGGAEDSLTQRDWSTHVTILDGQAGGSVVTVLAGCRINRIDGFIIRNGTGVGPNDANRSGGGIYCSGASPIIVNNTITQNITTNGGAGIDCHHSTTPLIVNNRITANSTQYGSGAGILCYASSPTICGNAITDNRAPANYAGGILCEYYSFPTISNNVIARNAANTAYGGGIYCGYKCSVVINNNVINANTANNGGGVACGSGSVATIVDNVIAGNSNSGIYCSSSTPVIVNNTIMANGRAGVTCYSATASLANNIVAFNSSGIYASGGALTLLSNCVYNPGGANYTGLSPGVGDLALDPQVQAVQYGQVHLRAGSPCIDAGVDNQVPAGSTDIDAQPRIQGARVDIGADEFTGDDPPAFIPHIVRVSHSGSDANDGSSWTLAKQTVQAGVDAASAAGGEVWVAAGTYRENIVLHPWAYAYGGFQGTESDRSQRNAASRPTILDGTGAGSVVSVLGGVGFSALDGFTIVNGGGTLSGNARYGGGVYCKYTSPTLSNNVIIGNFADYGSGIYCANSTSAILNNTIAGNDGSGILCSNASPTIANNVVVFNGAGIGASGGAAGLRNNCVYNPGGQNYSGLTAGAGDISVDPHLMAVGYGQVHLSAISPCIDHGLDSKVPSGSVDMDGEPRIQGLHVDIGADEFNDAAVTFTPPVIRVSPAGDDANDGSTWELAKRTVQAGIDAAAAQGGDIWVAAGTYNERIVLPQWVYAYGGFTGQEVTLDQRDWIAAPAILNGGAGGSVVTARCGYRNACIDGFEIRNGVAASGAGICCVGASPVIAHNTITANTADYGGGIYCSRSAALIQENRITANTGLVEGGGLHSSIGKPQLTRCIFNRNLAPSGGGMYISRGSPTIASCAFDGNSADSGGGIFNFYCSPVLFDCVFRGNVAAWTGGAIQGYFDYAYVVNCTLGGNASPSGAALYSYYGSPSFANCVLWANDGTAISASDSMTPAVRYCVVQGGCDGTGNIDRDPLFLRNPEPGPDGVWQTPDDDYGDLRLAAGSPCIDAGMTAAMPVGAVVDLDGHGRFHNDPATPDCQWAPGTCGTAPIVDMGAYEFIAGDFDRDGDLDGGDVVQFAACLSGPSVVHAGDCLKADLDRDGDVDLADYGVFQRCYSGEGKAVEPGCVR